MRLLTLALTTFGTATISHVAAQQQQQQWQGFGAMPSLMRQSFYDAVARPPSLAKRDGACGHGRHPCSDLNSTLCCPNTDYCTINETSLRVQCCELGSTCGFTCGTDAFYEVITTTATTSGTTTTGTAGACVGRPCSSTNYLCPESMGANCCAYGQDCASSGRCLDSATSTTTTSTPAVATMIPSGISVAQPSAGLSTAAKAGIAVGVVVASAIVIGGATWLCLRRRRTGRSTTTGNEMGSGVGGDGADGADGGGGRRRRPNQHLAAAGRYQSDDGGVRAYGPSSGPHMSEADDGYAASSSAGGRGRGPGPGPGPLQGIGRDYFGPVAASGQYTTPPEHPHNNYGGGDDPARPVRGDGPTPHGPDDIASAVEIGGGSEDSLGAQRNKGAGDGGGGSELDGGSDTGLAARRQDRRQGAGSPAVRDSIAGRFEL